MRRTVVSALILAGAVLAFYGRLLDPGSFLAVRDLPFFHLPLRTVFAQLAALGLPTWNPMIHGGQPILSNPNYAAFYPPTWLALFMPVHYALSLSIVLHATLACVGAWSLIRHLGCSRSSAILGAIAFIGGGAFLSSPNTLTTFTVLAWLPWVLLWGDRLLNAPDQKGTRQALAWTAVCIGAQLLAGEPVAALISILALACLSVNGRATWKGKSARLAVVIAFGIALASAQILPTAQHLMNSPRAEGLETETSTTWSFPPARTIEWVLPHLFGDPMLEDVDLYFGYGFHDKDFPYVISIYLGPLLFVLALITLIRGPAQRRLAWGAMVVLGIGLALGRFNPIYDGVLAGIPPFSLIRYPEKFILLAHTGLAFAAAEGWQHLLETRRKGKGERVDLAIALAVVALLVAILILGVAIARPDAVAWFVRNHTPLPRTDAAMEAAISYLRIQLLIATATALATCALLVGHRTKRLPETLLISGAVLLAGMDLWIQGRTVNPVAPADAIISKPATLQALAGAERIVTDQGIFAGRTTFTFRGSDPDVFAWLSNGIDRLDPYVANLWKTGYVLNEDYDLMLTRTGRRALGVYYEAASDGGITAEPAMRVAGAWGASRMLVRRGAREVAAEWERTGELTSLSRIARVPWELPTVRFIEEVTTHETESMAVEQLRKEGYHLGSRDHWIAARSALPPRKAKAGSTARVHEVRHTSRGLEVDYRTNVDTYLVAAATWDRGWGGTLNGDSVKVYATALGQLGIPIPKGEGTLKLAYRQPGLAIGVALSLLTLLGLAVTIVASSRESIK